MKINLFLLLVFLFSCTQKSPTVSLDASGEIFVLGSSWSVDPDISPGLLFSSLLNDRFRSGEKNLKVTHLGVHGESPAQVLDRLSALGQKKSGLLILEVDGYFSPESSVDRKVLLPKLKEIFPEVPFWVIHLGPVGGNLKDQGNTFSKITWIDLQTVRESRPQTAPLSGNAALHQKLAEYLDARLSGN